MRDDVGLDPELEEFIARAVANGQFASVDDAWASIDAAIERGLADIEAGRVVPAEEVFDRLIKKYQAMAGRRAREDDAQP
ncbi:MAG TPA: type II toxin-antitoxin system ParD family antitoxin [Caulobacteraceae bacterium]|jgi:antitoxin ParD1/3/4|nr:type II toxin-antitoxin system ParD family antitoxin [Caulobacteraceae bacterium]